MLSGFLGWYTLNKGKYHFSLSSDVAETGSACCLSRIFCMNSHTWAAFVGLCLRLLSNEIARFHAASRLLCKMGLQLRKGKGAVHLPLSDIWNPESIISRKVWSSTDSPSHSSNAVRLNTGSSFTYRELSQGSKYVCLPFPSMAVLLTVTMVCEWAVPRHEFPIRTHPKGNL